MDDPAKVLIVEDDPIIRTVLEMSLHGAGFRHFEAVGSGKMLEAGASEGMVITYVNDQPLGTPQDVLNIAKSAKRAVYIEGVTANGRKAFFGFSKE